MLANPSVPGIPALSSGQKPASTDVAGTPQAANIARAAEAVEASFVAAMLSAAGAFAPRQAHGGGAGEAAFADVRLRLVAKDIAASAPLGIAEAVIASLAEW